MNNDVFAEIVRNASMEQNVGSRLDLNQRPSEYQSHALTIKSLGPLADEQKTSYISSTS